MLTREDIDGYFRDRDWTTLKRADNVWWTGLRGRIKNYQKGFEIFVHLDDDWVYLQTILLKDIDENCKNALYEYLLELNYRIFLAKFSLEGRRVILTSELPRTCGIEQLNDGLWALDEYTNQYFLEIMTLAFDRDIAALWLNRNPRSSHAPELEEEVPDIIFND